MQDDLYKKIMKFLEKSGYYDIDSARFTKTFTAIMSEAKKDELLEDCGYTSNLQEGRDKIHKYLESLRVRMRDNPTSFRSDYNKIFGRDPSPLQSDSTEDDGQSKKLSQHLARGTKAHLLIPHESEDNLKHFYKLGICISDCPGGDQCSCNDNTRVFITELHPDPFQEGNKIFMEHHVNNITPPNIPALKRYVQYVLNVSNSLLPRSDSFLISIQVAKTSSDNST